MTIDLSKVERRDWVKMGASLCMLAGCFAFWADKNQYLEDRLVAGLLMMASSAVFGYIADEALHREHDNVALVALPPLPNYWQTQHQAVQNGQGREAA